MKGYYNINSRPEFLIIVLINGITARIKQINYCNTKNHKSKKIIKLLRSQCTINRL